MKLIAIIRSISLYIKLNIMKCVGINIVFTPYNHIGKCVRILLDKGSNVALGRHIGLRDNVCLSVRKGAILKLGNGVFLNNGCQVVTHKSITLGDNVRCGQNTMFFDHDYDYKNEGGFLDKKYITEEIIIGKGTWIGAGCIILKGTTIGKNCVIGAGSVVKGVIPDNSILIQKREEQIRKLRTK